MRTHIAALLFVKRDQEHGLRFLFRRNEVNQALYLPQEIFDPKKRKLIEVISQLCEDRPELLTPSVDWEILDVYPEYDENIDNTDKTFISARIIEVRSSEALEQDLPTLAQGGVWISENEIQYHKCNHLFAYKIYAKLLLEYKRLKTIGEV